MSTFEVLITPIDEVIHHPDADRLSIIRIGGYEAISQKNEDGSHRFEAGELVVYVPEGAVVPEHLLKQRGFWNQEKNVGMLAGSKGNRVKAIRLRGVLSQGLVWKLERHGSTHVLDVEEKWKRVEAGENVAEWLGIVKYEEPIPASMSGKAFYCEDAVFHFDIENIQKFPDLLVEGEEVVATEKVHGTCFRVTYMPRATDKRLFAGKVAITSKGLGAKGLVFEDNEENRRTNLYVQTALEVGLIEAIMRVGDERFPGQKVTVLAEIFGKGVQDLTYGFERKVTRVFDVHSENHGYVPDFWNMKDEVIADLGLERVPVLYRGPFNVEELVKVRDGKTTFNSGFNVREGVVVTAAGPQEVREVGNYRLRPIVKTINPDYLLRKGGTELQ